MGISESGSGGEFKDEGRAQSGWEDQQQPTRPAFVDARRSPPGPPFTIYRKPPKPIRKPRRRPSRIIGPPRRPSRPPKEIDSSNDSITQSAEAVAASEHEKSDEGAEHPERPEHPEGLTDSDLAAEARDDWDNGASPVLDEIYSNLEHVNEPTKDECRKLVIRIKGKGTTVVRQGAAAQQAVLLNLIIDFLMLTDTVTTAPAADDSEQELLELIGRKIKGRLALRVWSIISKLGRLQQWTVTGEVGISIFGMVTGTGSLSITFGK